MVMYKAYKNTFLLSGALIFVGLALYGNTFADGTDVVDVINVTVPVSCTMSGSGMTSHNADISNGTYQADIGTTTLYAFCNDNSGFAIYAAGYTGNEIGTTNSNKLVGTSASGNATIITGTATSAGDPDISNWAVKLTVTQDSGDMTGTNAFTIDNSFNAYHTVPNEYTKVAHKESSTNMDTTTGGVKLTTTYAAYISKTQPADTYSGQVIYTLVHPASETAPLHPVPCSSGKICYNPNSTMVIDTMADQVVSSSATSIRLLPSNYQRTGYGFAGWSDVFDYETNPNAHFYGPMETITFTAGQYDGESGTTNGLSLYAVWVESEGSFQDDNKIAELCDSNTGSLIQAPINGTATLSSVSALTDERDGDTYAIAKLADGKCWMIENLRLSNEHIENGNTADTVLTAVNTNNPSLPLTNVYDASNPTMSNHLSTSLAPNAWCMNSGLECTNQSVLNTSNVVSASESMTDARWYNIYSYGNYYNWYSATAGNGTYEMVEGNTQGDICFNGWHLPTGKNDGDFNELNIAINSGATGSDAKYRIFPANFVLAGQIYGTPGYANFDLRGDNGFYWSSTAGNDYSYKLSIYNNIVDPGLARYYGRFYGFSVRCVWASE